MEIPIKTTNVSKEFIDKSENKKKEVFIEDEIDVNEFKDKSNVGFQTKQNNFINESKSSVKTKPLKY